MNTMKDTKIDINFEDKYKKSPKKAFRTKKKPKKKNHIQGKRKKDTSFHFSPDSKSAQCLINDTIEEDNIQQAEYLIDQAERLIEQEKDEIPEIEPNIKEDEKKEVMPDASDDLKVCPYCQSKLIKGKVTRYNNIYSQIIKCKKCDFQREIKQMI